MVPVLSIVFMAVAGLTAFVLAFGLLIYFRIAKKADIAPFFVGCAVMILFAFVLERIFHSVILGSPAGAVIQGNTWLYALYGGLMAGLFEETGRFLAFRTVLKKYQGKNVNALMYGAGHGGIEAIVLLGITSVNNIIYSVFINSGQTARLTTGLTGDALAQVESAIEQLKAYPSAMFLLGGVERIFAVVLQISLSILVWTAVKKNKRFLYPAAILIHLFVDAITVVLSASGVSTYILEGVVGILAIWALMIAKIVWKKELTE